MCHRALSGHRAHLACQTPRKEGCKAPRKEGHFLLGSGQLAELVEGSPLGQGVICPCLHKASLGRTRGSPFLWSQSEQENPEPRLPPSQQQQRHMILT